jgi:hypothetical protein
MDRAKSRDPTDIEVHVAGPGGPDVDFFFGATLLVEEVLMDRC